MDRRRCRSWYLDPDGGTSVLWPGYTGQFRRAVRRFDPSDYEIVHADEPAAAPVLAERASA